MAKAIGAEAVCAQHKVSWDEAKSEERIKVAMKEEGVEVRLPKFLYLSIIPFLMQWILVNAQIYYITIIPIILLSLFCLINLVF
ncbi:uncharacterized protein J3R85_020107 [Psidium guajava]|nr:uncharacterized protein J3R85_020107 [Psidium guajava]